MQDLKKMEINYWISCVQERRKWEGIVEKVQIFNYITLWRLKKKGLGVYFLCVYCHMLSVTKALHSADYRIGKTCFCDLSSLCVV